MVAATWSARVWRRVGVSETSSSRPVVKMPWWSSRSRWAGSMRVSSLIGGTGRAKPPFEGAREVEGVGEGPLSAQRSVPVSGFRCVVTP